MADIRDERGNSIYLTDEQGKPAQLVDEFGNAMHLTGVATTVPHLKESSYTGPHPISAPITTTETPHHAQPISVSHNPLENIGISSSNSVKDLYISFILCECHTYLLLLFFIYYYYYYYYYQDSLYMHGTSHINHNIYTFICRWMNMVKDHDKELM